MLTFLVAADRTGTAALAAPTKRVDAKDACTLLGVSKVQRAFGGPVKTQRGGPLPTAVCYYLVGTDPARAPGGTLTATIEYRKGDRDATNAIEAVERVVDPDVAGGVEVEALGGVGKDAYVYPDDGQLIVAATRTLAFRLLWAPAGQSAALTPETRRALLRLAKDTVKRAS